MTIKSYSSIMVSFAQDEEVEDIANILNLSLEEQTIQEPSKRKNGHEQARWEEASQGCQSYKAQLKPFQAKYCSQIHGTLVFNGQMQCSKFPVPFYCPFKCIRDEYLNVKINNQPC